MTKCKKIQWSKLHTINGKACCPECAEPAKMIIGMIGEPCWAHEIKKSEERLCKHGISVFATCQDCGRFIGGLRSS